MRDILVTLIVFGVLPLVFTRPHFGILLWAWIGYMNPHRLGWGFAYNLPFAAVVAIATIASLFIARKKLSFFWPPVIKWLLLFNFWLLITTIFSLNPVEAWPQWQKVIKIQFMTFLTLWIMNDKEKIHGLVWIIALSIGFYGIKGGIFTLTTGGVSHVLGPEGSFIQGNTEIGLAMVTILPLVWYLYLNTANSWIRAGLILAMLLTPVAILGTQSRGALLAIGSITFFLWLKSRRKALLFIIILLLAPFLFMFMPQSWHERMESIGNYEEDGSAQGRLLAWEFAYKMALARPLGGGFESFTPDNYYRFAPEIISSVQDAHSIYFEILGEHGFVGLGIFLILGILSWRNAGKIIKLTKNSPDNKWAYDLASMIQVSLIGYATGGAFLGLAYFDLSYHLLVILVLVLRIVEQQDSANTYSANT